MGILFRWKRLLCKYRLIRFILLSLLMVTCLIGSFLKSIDFESMPGETSGLQRMKDIFHSVTRRTEEKFAYVFYATNSDYCCYALVNAHRLISVGKDPKIDIVIIATDYSGIKKFCPNLKCPYLDEVKIKVIPRSVAILGQSLTRNAYYMDSYVRFEAFKLYDEYDRLVILDADGLILKNLDHLFQLDLGEYHLAASFAYYQTDNWLSSVLLVVNPSKDLYDLIKEYLDPDSIGEVSDFANGAHYDMDVLNYIFESGNLSYILPKNYSLLDTYFFKDDDPNTRTGEDELQYTYYVHFTGKKPLAHMDTRPWPLLTNATDPDFILPPHNSTGFNELVYNSFWTSFDTQCRMLVRPHPTIGPDEAKDVGEGVPDPDKLIAFINKELEKEWVIER